MTSVRQQIIDAVVLAIGGIDGVGKVTHALDPDPGISDVFANGDVFVDFIASDNERDDAASVIGAEAWKFDVVVLVHFDENDQGVMRADQFASVWDEKLYMLYAAEADRQWGGLARDTRPLGGGGVGISDRGYAAVAHAFEVSFRHEIGNAGVPL